ncbi:hypothetical protein JXB41_01950 [Candidatus Woesearchaeota archaeon]|nr:hypothetical protein [Candidatus Woesearchaeota archaeon]
MKMNRDDFSTLHSILSQFKEFHELSKHEQEFLKEKIRTNRPINTNDPFYLYCVERGGFPAPHEIKTDAPDLECLVSQFNRLNNETDHPQLTTDEIDFLCNYCSGIIADNFFHENKIYLNPANPFFKFKDYLDLLYGLIGPMPQSEERLTLLRNILNLPFEALDWPNVFFLDVYKAEEHYIRPNFYVMKGLKNLFEKLNEFQDYIPELTDIFLRLNKSFYQLNGHLFSNLLFLRQYIDNCTDFLEGDLSCDKLDFMLEYGEIVLKRCRNNHVNALSLLDIDVMKATWDSSVSLKSLSWLLSKLPPIVSQYYSQSELNWRRVDSIDNHLPELYGYGCQYEEMVKLSNLSDFVVSRFVLQNIGSITPTNSKKINQSKMQSLALIGSKAYLFGLKSLMKTELDENDYSWEYELISTRLLDRTRNIVIGYVNTANILLEKYRTIFSDDENPLNVVSSQFDSLERIFICLERYDQEDASQYNRLYESMFSTVSDIANSIDASQGLELVRIMNMYLSTIEHLLTNFTGITIENIINFNNAFKDILKYSSSTGEESRPLEDYCLSIIRTDRYLPCYFDRAIEMLRTRYVSGLSGVQDIESSNLSAFELQQESLEKKAFIEVLSRYVRVNHEHKVRVKDLNSSIPLIDFHEQGKYWYTDIVTGVTMEALNCSSPEIFRNTIIEYFEESDLHARLGERATIRYIDYGAFTGAKTVVALEEICRKIAKPIGEVICSTESIQFRPRIEIELIEPSPGLLAVAHNNVLMTKSKLEEEYFIDIDIILSPNKDVTSISEGDEHPDTLCIHAFQNIWTNYERWQEFQKRLHLKKGDLLIFEGDVQKDIGAYKGDSVIDLRCLERYGIKEEHVRKWPYPGGFRYDHVWQGREGRYIYNEVSGKRKKITRSDDCNVRKYFEIKDNVHCNLEGEYAYYQTNDSGDIKCDQSGNPIIFLMDDPNLKGHIKGTHTYQPVMFTKSQIMYQMLSQCFDMPKVDEFYIETMRCNPNPFVSKDQRIRIYEKS